MVSACVCAVGLHTCELEHLRPLRRHEIYEGSAICMPDRETVGLMRRARIFAVRPVPCTTENAMVSASLFNWLQSAPGFLL